MKQLYDFKQELLKRYNEFAVFKTEESFEVYGFGVGGPHHVWLVDVRELAYKAIELAQILPPVLRVAPTELLHITSQFLFNKSDRSACEHAFHKLGFAIFNSLKRKK